LGLTGRVPGRHSARTIARPIRIEDPGAVYHVMARGSHGQELFQNDRDRQRFLETLGEACAKTGFRIHACVLMGNYYHLLLQTPEGNLVAGMKVMDCGSVYGGAAAVGE